MRSLYFWKIFQILTGIWLFASPFVLGLREPAGAATNNMIFGAIVVILGVEVSLYECYRDAGYLPRMEYVKKRVS